MRGGTECSASGSALRQRYNRFCLVDSSRIAKIKQAWYIPSEFIHSAQKCHNFYLCERNKEVGVCMKSAVPRWQLRAGTSAALWRRRDLAAAVCENRAVHIRPLNKK